MKSWYKIAQIIEPHLLSPEKLNDVPGYKYDPNLPSEGQYIDGTVVLGPKAYELSPEGRKNVILHEHSHELDSRMSQSDQMKILDAADKGILGERIETPNGFYLKSNFTGQYKPNEIVVDAYAHLMGSAEERSYVMSRAPKVAHLAMDIASRCNLVVPAPEWDATHSSPPNSYVLKNGFYSPV